MGLILLVMESKDLRVLYPETCFVFDIPAPTQCARFPTQEGDGLLELRSYTAQAQHLHKADAKTMEAAAVRTNIDRTNTMRLLPDMR